MFPPGNISTQPPPADVLVGWHILGEAALASPLRAGLPGPQGTSFLLRILPYMEGDAIASHWNFNAGISNTSANIAPYAPSCNFNLAITDIKGFYCPTRRSGVLPCDLPLMPSTAWTGGGTDYGGCAGRHSAFNTNTTYDYCEPADSFGNANPYSYNPTIAINSVPTPITPTCTNLGGIFGPVNRGVRPNDVTDGLSNTLMTGELQRLYAWKPTSKDGWALGGPCTLFTTGANVAAGSPHMTTGRRCRRRAGVRQSLLRLGWQRARRRLKFRHGRRVCALFHRLDGPQRLHLVGQYGRRPTRQPQALAPFEVSSGASIGAVVISPQVRCFLTTPTVFRESHQASLGTFVRRADQPASADSSPSPGASDELLSLGDADQSRT